MSDADGTNAFFEKMCQMELFFDSLQGNVLIVTQTAALRERINGDLL